MKKKFLAMTMIVALAVTALAGCSKKSEGPSGSLIIGQVTELTGDFGDGWTNGAADADVKYLIGGYATVAYTREGIYEVDPTVVKEYEATENADGSKTFTFTINDNLVYNTGLEITAKDYVFSILLKSSKEFESLGANATAGLSFVGYDEFYNGETKTFAGVRLLGDYQFAVTIKAEELPYFYEMALASVSPLPMSVYAPGVDITDNGEGATFSDNYTAELIAEPVESERYNPTVTAGPYQLESYDSSSKQAVLVINDKFLGTYDGVKPSIEKLIFRVVDSATQMDELAAGTVDLITGVSGGSEIQAGLDLVDQDAVNYTTYLRNGYGKIAFVCDFGPTQFAAVRQAIAYTLDRNEFAAQYSGGYAQVVHGYYGLGQWVYQANKTGIDNELNTYSFNLDKAKELLIEDGWIYNEKGEDFVEGVDEVRYKLVDGELMPCIINWAMTDNIVSQLLNTMLPDNMAAVGMKLNSTVVDWSVLTNHLYRQNIEEPVYHMFNMGVSFARVNDPYYYYNSDPMFDSYNNNKIYDEELERLAKELRETDSQDKEGYAAKWFEFMKRWNEVLPDIPLYSDEYHDFFNKKLQNYEVSAEWSAREQLVYCTVK